MNEDLLADLPPPFEDEPSLLRRDIADELGDHLACAFHRELVKTADEQTAKDRVLERFGDPLRIARQLWWQAMWSRIMLQKISIGLQSVLVVVLVLLVALLRQMQAHQQQFTADAAQLRAQTSANQMMLAQLVEQLRDVDLPRRAARQADASGSMAGMMGTAAAGDMGMSSMGGFSGIAMLPGTGGEGGGMAPPLPLGASTLSLVVTMEKEDGPPAERCLVGILDDAEKPLSLSFGTSESGYGTPAMMSGGYGGSGGMSPFGAGQPSLQTTNGAYGFALTLDAQGRVDAGRVDPGRYTVIIEFPNGWYTHHKIVVRPGKQHIEKIACPKPPEKAFVNLAAPVLPPDLQNANVRLVAELNPRPAILGRVNWSLMSANRVALLFAADLPEPEAMIERPVLPTQGGSRLGRFRSFESETADERFLVLPTGDVRVTLSLCQFSSDQPFQQFQDHWGAVPSGAIHTEPPAALATLGGESITLTIEPGQSARLLDRAAELFEPARKKLAETESP